MSNTKQDKIRSMDEFHSKYFISLCYALATTFLVTTIVMTVKTYVSLGDAASIGALIKQVWSMWLVFFISEIVILSVCNKDRKRRTEWKRIDESKSDSFPY